MPTTRKSRVVDLLAHQGRELDKLDEQCDAALDDAIAKAEAEDAAASDQ
jgi:hypothetical protein